MYTDSYVRNWPTKVQEEAENNNEFKYLFDGKKSASKYHENGIRGGKTLLLIN